MSETVTSPYDIAEHLRTREEMAAYLEASIEDADGDAALVAKALGDIARARGMSRVAGDAGLSRESLYKALSGDRNPTLDTVLKVVDALGLRPACRSGTGCGRGRAPAGSIGETLANAPGHRATHLTRRAVSSRHHAHRGVMRARAAADQCGMCPAVHHVSPLRIDTSRWGRSGSVLS